MIHATVSNWYHCLKLVPSPTMYVPLSQTGTISNYVPLSQTGTISNYVCTTVSNWYHLQLCTTVSNWYHLQLCMYHCLKLVPSPTMYVPLSQTGTISNYVPLSQTGTISNYVPLSQTGTISNYKLLLSPNSLQISSVPSAPQTAALDRHWPRNLTMASPSLLPSLGEERQTGHETSLTASYNHSKKSAFLLVFRIQEWVNCGTGRFKFRYYIYST